MYDLGEHFRNKHPELLNASEKTIFKGDKYRITVLTERLLRLEYDPEGKFYDYETPIVKNRLFNYPIFIMKEDQNYITIETKYLSLTYVKNAEFASNTIYCDVLGTKNRWVYGDKEVYNFGSCTTSLDGLNKMPNLRKGLYSPLGFATIDDSKSLFLDGCSNVYLNNNQKHVDMYLFVYNKDFGLCLQDYYSLTGYPSFIPRYALGNWWSRDYAYSKDNVIELIEKFERKKIPLSVFLLEDWAKLDQKNYPNVKLGFSFNPELFKDPLNNIKEIKNHNVRLGLKINPYYGFYPFENYFETAKKYINTNKQGYIDLNLYDARMMDLYLKIFIHPLVQIGVDFFWNDFNTNSDNNLFILNDYMDKDSNTDNIRNVFLSRNSNYAAHRYNVLYSGKTLVSWDTLKMLPKYNLTAANIGVSYWSHDVGGAVGGIEDSELYLRGIQYGVFSPILRFNTEKGNYFKREPWKWDFITENIASYYLRLRNKLIPYLYTEVYHYHNEGNNIIKPFYYSNPECYDDPNYVNQYYFGNSFMISPIINPMDEVIERTIQKFYMPSGVWYDFKTGKRFLGDHKYISFYKIEDYPIFVKQGSIIPMTGDDSVMSTENPKDLEIHVFPGVSNTYHLFEDDGISYDYKNGKYMITELDYNYRKSNYTMIIRKLEGDSSVVPEKRNYKVVFRNTKKADNVVVYLNDQIIQYESETTESDFIVKINDVPVNDQLTINCYGKDIEIDALMLIKDDIESILYDMKVNTKLKDEIATIMFSETVNLAKKRIMIKKLKKKGLDPRSIKVFLKLLEYMEM